MREIPLTQGLVAIVDDDDYAALAQYKWHASRNRGSVRRCYAQRWTGHFYAGSRRRFLMHRVILGATTKQQVDHLDGNGLNNQKCNLRFCTNAQNQQNRMPSPERYKGVRLLTDDPRRTKPWFAAIHADGRTISLGVFASADDAARAYNEAARNKFGEFARLNKIGEDNA